jgi:hypothetical protein
MSVYDLLGFIRLKRTSSKEKNISRPLQESLEPPSKAGGKNLIFISTEPVAMNNCSPPGAEYLNDFSGSEKSLNSFFSRALRLYRVFEGARDKNVLRFGPKERFIFLVSFSNAEYD